MSPNSGFSSSSPETVRGSSAIPQMGQDPGPGRTTCGCIGQVYSTRDEITGVSRSKAMPHFGQGPGTGFRTSVHMGQT
jgi:hypothetical protein